MSKWNEAPEAIVGVVVIVLCLVPGDNVTESVPGSPVTLTDIKNEASDNLEK